jgi:predicted DNA-binding mobile mystery protein A
VSKATARQAKARGAIDRRYPQLQAARASASRPTGGWLRAVREALGMTTLDVAQRLAVQPSTIHRFETSEQAGHIQLDTLARAADALGCELVYLLVPRRPLEEVVDERARELARRELRSLGHTMDLEDQGVPELLVRDREQELVVEIKSRPGLWRE